MAHKSNSSFKDNFPYIFLTDEASDLKFGTHLEFAETHNKITPRRKSGRGPGLGELPEIVGFLFKIPAMVEASDFKFCLPFGLANVRHKIIRRRISGRGPGLQELPTSRVF